MNKDNNQDQEDKDLIGLLEEEGIKVSRHHGDNVRYWRDHQKLTQEFVAAQLGVTQQYIQKIEKQPVIKDELLDKISKVIDIPVNLLKASPIDKEKGISYIKTFHNRDNATYNFQYFNYSNVKPVIDAYQLLIDEKDKQIELLKETIKDITSNKR